MCCCRYGRRIVYLVSTVAFLGATFGCIFAPNVSTLVAFRALQGAGGEAVMLLVTLYVTFGLHVQLQLHV
jgi:MFS family permease